MPSHILAVWPTIRVGARCEALLQSPIHLQIISPTNQPTSIRLYLEPPLTMISIIKSTLLALAAVSTVLAQHQVTIYNYCGQNKFGHVKNANFDDVSGSLGTNGGSYSVSLPALGRPNFLTLRTFVSDADVFTLSRISVFDYHIRRVRRVPRCRWAWVHASRVRLLEPIFPAVQPLPSRRVQHPSCLVLD